MQLNLIPTTHSHVRFCHQCNQTTTGIVGSGSRKVSTLFRFKKFSEIHTKDGKKEEGREVRDENRKKRKDENGRYFHWKIFYNSMKMFSLLDLFFVYNETPWPRPPST